MQRITMDQVRALDAAFPGNPDFKCSHRQAAAVRRYFERLGAGPFEELRAYIPAFGGASTGIDFAASEVDGLDEEFPLYWSLRRKDTGASWFCKLIIRRIASPDWPIDKGTQDQMIEMGYESFVVPTMPDALVLATRDWFKAQLDAAGYRG